MKQLDRAAFDESGFAALKDEIAAYVAGPGGGMGGANRARAPRSARALGGSARAWISLARRTARVRRPRHRLHALLRADRALLDVARFDPHDRPRRQRHLASDGSIRNAGATPHVRRPVGAGRLEDRVYADRADRGNRRRPSLQRRARRRHVLLERREAPHYVRNDLRLLAPLRTPRRHARRRRNRRAARRSSRTWGDGRRDGRVDGRARNRSRALALRSRAGSGR